MPKVGDVVLVPFPFANLAGDKIRPALVLGIVGHDVILAAISSQVAGKRWPSDLEIKTSDPKFGATGLKTDSLIRLGKLATVESPIILGQLGWIDTKHQKEIARKLRSLFNS